MNTLTVSAPATCHHPRVLPPLSITRLVDFVVDRWDAWRERRAQRRALEALARLDPTTLRDLGLEDEAAARAVAHAEARLALEAGAQRSSVMPW